MRQVVEYNYTNRCVQCVVVRLGCSNTIRGVPTVRVGTPVESNDITGLYYLRLV